MIEKDNTALIVTARMSGAGLPGAPLAHVAGKPLVAKVADDLSAFGLGSVMVATPDLSVSAALHAQGLAALVVPGFLKTDNLMAAGLISMRDAQRKFSHVVVVPGVLAGLDDLALRRCLASLENKDVDVATLAGPEDAEAPLRLDVPLAGRDVAWVRGVAETGHAHVPVYAWHRAALEKFAGLADKTDAPELARALAGGLRVAAVKVDTMPIVVDTPQALEAARRLPKV